MDNTNTINEIRSKVDIVKIISSYIPLTQKGKNYFGVCPFHDDTNPSMSVSPDKQIYKCFSCGASGNVFDFVMNYEHVSFKEALGILAEKAGIEIKGIDITKAQGQDITKNVKARIIHLIKSNSPFKINLINRGGINAKNNAKKQTIGV